MDTIWNEMDNALVKTFRFSSFLNAMDWMQKASVEIERLNHHPEWTNIYNRVTVKLCTHDKGNTITEKDRQLSAILDAIPVK